MGIADSLSRIIGYSIIRYTNMTMNKECAGAKGVHNYKLVGVYY